MYPMTTDETRTADTGQYGYGAGRRGKAAAAVIINEVYIVLLLHRDPFNVEYLWDIICAGLLSPSAEKALLLKR